MKMPILDFTPLFLILDRSNKRILAVREHDGHYAVKGMYIKYDNEMWEIWPAYLSKQEFKEYPDNWDFTHNLEEALNWSRDNRKYPPLKKKVRATDFPVY